MMKQRDEEQKWEEEEENSSCFQTRTDSFTAWIQIFYSAIIGHKYPIRDFCFLPAVEQTNDPTASVFIYLFYTPLT